MNKVIVTLLLIVPVVSFGQKIIYGKIVAGNYWMQDVKKLQTELRDEYNQEGIPAEIVLSFPMSLQGELGMDFSIYDDILREYVVGGFVNYTFTEGLITYSDYSGRVDVEQSLRRFSAGGRCAYGLTDNIQVCAKVSYQMTYFDTTTRTILYGSESDQHEARSDLKGLAFEPGFQWTKLVDRLRFSIHGGYEFNGIITRNAGDAQPGWDGFRLGAGVGLSL